MTQFEGYKGNMKFDVSTTPTPIGNCHVWGVTLTGDTVEITDFSSTGWKTFLATLKSWGMTGEAYLDETDGAQVALRAAVAGAAATIQAWIDATNGYYGEGIVTSWAPGAAVDGVITVSFALQGSGALNYGAPV